MINDSPTIISGKSNLRSSIRPISASGPELSSKSGRYLDVSIIFQDVFPDLTDNTLGERREHLLKQAAHYESRRLREEVEKSSSGNGYVTPSITSSDNTHDSEYSEIEREYLEDEEWHQKMVEYLAKATNDFNTVDRELARAERYIMESRGRTASADENRRAHHLEPIQASPFVTLFDESKLKTGVLPKSLILPSEFYPQRINPPPVVQKSPRYRQETISSKAAAAVMEARRPTAQFEKVEVQSQTSSVDHKMKPRVPKQSKELKTKKNDITLPGLSHKGYSRQEDEEHRSLERHLERMKNTTFDFLRNPRSETPKIKKVFEPIPPEIRFSDWDVGTVIETILELRNNDEISRAVTVLPPENPHFHLGLGRYPSADGQVGPGLSVLFRIQFMPDSLADDESSLEVRHQGGRFIIPIRAVRPKPLLTIPSKINIGHSLINSSTRFLTRILNQGGRGKFCFVRKTDWPTANFKTAVEPGSTTIGQFTIWPSMFELEHQEEQDLIILFEPGNVPIGEYKETILLTCDNCQTKEIDIVGVAEEPAVRVDINEKYNAPPDFGELRDRFSIKRLRIPLGYPGASLYSSYIEFDIENLTHVDLVFEFKFVFPKLVAAKEEIQIDSNDITFWNLSAITREEDMVSPFKICPRQDSDTPLTLLPPDSSTRFCIFFNPIRPGLYNTVLRLSLFQQQQQLTTKQSLIINNADTRTMEYEIIGECKEICARIMPQVMNIPGEIPAGSRLKRDFYLINQLLTDPDNPEDENKIVKFKWQQTKACSIEPSFGSVLPGESVPLQLCIEADRSGTICEKMKCEIDFGPTLEFEVNAVIKEPKVTLNIGKVVFGIVEVGKTKEIDFKIINRNPIRTKWAAFPHNLEIQVSPSTTIIEPLDEIAVKVLWTPQEEYCIDNQVLTLYGAPYDELLLEGEAIRPLVEFEQISINIEDTFVGVQAKFDLKVINKGPIPATFSFIESNLLPSVPQTLKFWPAASNNLSQLSAFESRDISIELISYEKQTFKDFIIAADVFNSKRPALIEVLGDVRVLELEVTCDDERCNKLNFELNQLYEVKSQRLKIQNKTGIKSSFRITSKYLYGKNPKVSYENHDFKWDAEGDLKQPLRTRKSIASRKTTELAKREFVKQMNKKSTYGVTLIADLTEGDLGPFENREINVIVSGLGWGEYRDTIQIHIDEKDLILLDVHISSKVAPITSPTSFIRFGGVSMLDNPKKKIPITNLAPHPVKLNFYMLDAVEQMLFDEYDEIPIPIGDEDVPAENSVYNSSEFSHVLGNFSSRKMPFRIQSRLHLEANEQMYVEVNFDNSKARFGLNKATLLAQLSLAIDDKKDGIVYERPTGNKGPMFEMEVSATLDANRCKIEPIDEFTFSTSISSLDSQKRAFSVFNPTKSTSTFVLKTNSPFSLSDGKTEPAEEYNLTLPKNQRKVLYLYFEPKKNVKLNNVQETDTIISSGKLVTTGLSENYAFDIQALIYLPKIISSRTVLDFSKRTTGQIYKLELTLENDSMCESTFEFGNLDETIFVSETSGVIRQGEPKALSVLFAPKEEIVYERDIILNLFHTKQIIKVKGIGTGNMKYAYGSNLYY